MVNPDRFVAFVAVTVQTARRETGALPGLTVSRSPATVLPTARLLLGERMRRLEQAGLLLAAAGVVLVTG